MRLPHGYTNHTTLAAGTVAKTYSGDDAKLRLTHEAAALQVLQGALPVPQVQGYDLFQRVLQTSYLPGWHGQELIEEGHASEVLYVCGTLLQQLQSIPPSRLDGIIAGTGPVLSHGDFGPQNLLLNPAQWTATGVLDWEWVHLGSPIEDLAWAEWIVRTHHPAATDALPELFQGYGQKPAWQERHAAMLAKCQFLLDYSMRNGNEGAVRLWEERLQKTAMYGEVG